MISNNKAQLAEYGIVVVTIAFLLAAMYFIPPRLTGLAVIPPGASVENLTPTAAIDWLYNEQISPDNGANDGTIDLSNNDARSLNADRANINVTTWDQAIPQSTINNVTAYCEIDASTNKPGSLSFSYNSGSGWSNWICIQPGGLDRILKCDLFKNGIDTLTEVNNLDLRCRMNTTQSGQVGFSIDSIKLEVVYTVTTTTSTSTSTTSTTSTSTIPSTTSTSTTSTSTSTTSSSTSISTTSTSTSISTTSTSTSTSTTSTSTSTSTSSTSISSTSTTTSTTSTSTSTSTTSTTTSSTSTSTSTSSTSTSTTSTSTSTTSTSTSTSSTSTSSTSSSTSTPTTSTSTSTSTSTTSSTTSTSTSSSTSTSTTITSTSTSTSTTIEPETTVEETSNRRRETTTIQPLETSILSTIIQPETTEITTTIAQLPATTIAPPTGQFALAGRAITNDVIQPVENRLLILISSILGLIYIYYKQVRKHFPRKAHINELKKNRKRGYY